MKTIRELFSFILYILKRKQGMNQIYNINENN